MKDEIIRKRLYSQQKLAYWKDKVERFKVTEVQRKFTIRQSVDTSIIGKYAKEYLKSIFNKQVFVIRGETTAEFRRYWNLQDYYSHKDRSNHTHHAIDAIVIACIQQSDYHKWINYHESLYEYDIYRINKPKIEKPWETFTEDVKSLAENMLVYHYNKDNTLKQTKKKLRDRRSILRNTKNDIMYSRGDTARVQLHKDTFYGAIKSNDEIVYVYRKMISKLTVNDVKSIVDKTVKGIIEAEIERRGGFNNLRSEPIYMNKEKGIEIKKVRIVAKNIKSPIHLKPHRDLSNKEHKRDYLVENSGNYCMGIYEGTNEKGKVKTNYKLVKNVDAIKNFKAGSIILPPTDENNYILKYILKPGTMVLFYENDPAELYNASISELSQRLYIVTGISFNNVKGYLYGNIDLRYHQEARPKKELKAKFGAWKIGENHRPLITIRSTQFKALIEGVDFDLSPTGKISFNK